MTRQEAIRIVKELLEYAQDDKVLKKEFAEEDYEALRTLIDIASKDIPVNRIVEILSYKSVNSSGRIFLTDSLECVAQSIKDELGI